MSDENDSASEKSGEATPAEILRERDRLCRELADFVDGCRTSEDPEDLRRLRDACLAANGVPVQMNQRDNAQWLAVDTVSTFLAILRNPRHAHGFDEGLAALPMWLARDCDPAFADARIDGRVREIVRRSYSKNGDVQRGAYTLVALLAIRTRAWRADEGFPPNTEGPTWWVRKYVEKYAENVLRPAVERVKERQRQR